MFRYSLKEMWAKESKEDTVRGETDGLKRKGKGRRGNGEGKERYSGKWKGKGEGGQYL